MRPAIVSRTREVLVMPKNDVLVFIHIPKTAGTTLNRIIGWEYNPLRIFSINGRYFRSSYKMLKDCPPSRLAHMVLFRGHMPFGLHRYLERPARYMTVLRDPVERTISEYFFAVNRKIHRQHRQISQLSLEEYVRTSPYNNAQTKMIAGQDDRFDFLAGRCGPEMVALAKENLSRYFCFVGVTERFEESLALCKVLLGWKVRHYATFRVTPRRPRTETLTKLDLQVIRDYNSFDVELYSYAVQLFDDMVIKYQDKIQTEIRAVQRARVAGQVHLLLHRRICAAIKVFTLINSGLRCISVPSSTRALSNGKGMRVIEGEATQKELEPPNAQP
jgi:Galactose-3-O-sulfotransferase